MSAIDMYQLPNIISNDITVQLPTCMYKMKNIHLSKTQMAERLSNVASDGNITAQVKKFLKDISLSDLVMIENRQKILLNQLEELKQQLLKVKSILNVDERIPCSLPLVKTKQTMTKVPDILVSVNPNSPPYSLLFVKKILRNRIVLTTHFHSNISGIDENAEDFLKKFRENNGNSNCSTANIILIWKHLEISQMECCIDNSWLLGEVNLLRYLIRLLANSYYERHNVDEINYILDIIYPIYNASLTEINKYLGIFTSYLSKNGDVFLCGNELSIADVAAWSALKKFKNIELNVSLTKWMNKCENIILST